MQEGTREYRKALKLDPQDEGMKFALGIGAGQKRQALAVLKLQPGDIKSLSKLGYIAWNEQEYDEAIRRSSKCWQTIRAMLRPMSIWE